MEPVTHVLTGISLARAGFNRRAAYATLTMAIAAELPDIDTLWSLRGPVSGFEHHRGLPHTLLGIPLEAALLVGCVCLVHQMHQTRRLRHRSVVHAPTRVQAPVQWRVLYGLTLLALLSHILLDYTNNYGVRPFFPFNPRWYAGSIVFIFDPLIFCFLVAGLLLPSLFGFIGQEVGAKRQVFRGAGWARAALLAVLSLWSLRAYEHHEALSLAALQTLRAPAQDPDPPQTSAQNDSDPATAPLADRVLLQPLRSLASPDPFSPFHWYIATDFGRAYQLADADTRRSTLTPGPILNRPPQTSLTQAAERSRLGRIYLDWSPMPWISTPTEADPSSGIAVDLQDVRFMGSLSLLKRGPTPPLTGTVVLSRQGDVLNEGIDGRFGR